MIIDCIIGLGNPGPAFENTPHNMGFAALDALADKAHATWSKQGEHLIATLQYNNRNVLLIKPQTFMNDSGRVGSLLKKRGIAACHTLVVHDELELNLGVLKFKHAGSAKGHNGLRSLIEHIGADFQRLRCGIGRPEHKHDVAQYVLRPFNKQQSIQAHDIIKQSVIMIEGLFNEPFYKFA